MKLEKSIDNLKMRLVQQDDFNVPSLFELFDKEGRGYLNESTFERWFKENKVNLPHESFDLIFKRFAVAQQKGTIQSKNFQRVFLPFAGPARSHCMDPNNF